MNEAIIRARHGAETEKRMDSRISRWSQELRRIGSSPLAFCPNFPDIAQRWESWWRFEAERPLLRVAVPKDLSLRWDKGFDLLDQPAEWVRLRRRQVENMYFVGEEIPSARIDIGPVAPAAFLGAPLHMAIREQTSWQEAIIEDWDRPPSFTLDPQNVWYRRVLELSRVLARDAAGRYVVCFPDMSGALDALANLRGPGRLCMDLFDHRVQVKQAATQVMDAWEHMFSALHNTVLTEGAGVIQWLGCWSNAPYTVATCDFNALIGCEDFTDVCMPSLREQARQAGRLIFHLDGPAAARHADVLAADDAITAIQYVPGAGTPSALAKIDMLRSIQKAGKPVLIACLSAEVEGLCDQLDPRGLALMPWDVTSPAGADRLFRLVMESRWMK